MEKTRQIGDLQGFTTFDKEDDPGSSNETPDKIAKCGHNRGFRGLEGETGQCVSIPSFQHVTECTLHTNCTLTSFFPCLLSFPVCPQTDTAELYNTQSDLRMRTPHLAQSI